MTLNALTATTFKRETGKMNRQQQWTDSTCVLIQLPYPQQAVSPASTENQACTYTKRCISGINSARRSVAGPTQTSTFRKLHAKLRHWWSRET
jgi:hypothetical protein